MERRTAMRKVPLQEKGILNPAETAELYDFSVRKLSRLLKQKNLPFVLMYNKRKLVDRREFDEYLRLRPELKESLRNGEPRYKPSIY